MHQTIKLAGLILILSFSVSTAQAQFGKILKQADKVLKGEKNNPLSKDEVAKGLKEALDKGVGEAVTKLSAEKGYLESPFKILIPEDAKKVISKVKIIPGFENVEEELILKMNEAAEIAAKKATPIFVSAIKAMSFKDAMDILSGQDNAATNYLENSSRNPLYKEFMPVIQSALEEVNATKYWRDVVTKYNKLPFVSDVNPDLDDHVNNKALDGMFSLIAVKEKGIRNNVSERNSDLLKKVFGK